MTTTNSPKTGNEALQSLQEGLEQLRVANYYLRVALDQAPEGMVIARPDRNRDGSDAIILFNNANAAVLSGVSPEKGLRDLPLLDLAATDADAEILQQTLRRAREEGGYAECECALQRVYASGSVRCKWAVRAVFNAERDLLNYTVSFKEIAAAAAPPPPVQEDFDKQTARLRKDNLAALAEGMAHDVNNLLGLVTTRFSSVFEQMGLHPEIKRTLESTQMDTAPSSNGIARSPSMMWEELGLVLASLRRAREYTTQVVTSCKAKSRSPQPTSVGDLIDDTVRLSGSGSNVKVRIHVEEGTDWVMAEPVKISQVLQNLIMNGIQAMPSGGFMDVEARNREVALGGDPVLRPGGYVEIAVRDRGCGIPTDNMKKLFHDSFTTKTDGNGIGLTTCKRFIDEHHGDIRVKSTPNVGTEFTVLLPAVEAPADLKHARRAPATPVPVKNGTGTVLIVDDEDELRGLARMILERCGYQVVDCDNGQQAIETYRRLWMEGRSPDVVLMDLTLRGGLNGSETAAEILRIDRQARLVVTSGSVNQEVQMIFLEQGFIGVLPKPYEAGELTQTVHHITSLRQREAA